MKTPYRFLMAGLIAAPVILAQNTAPDPTGGGAAPPEVSAPVPAADPWVRQPEAAMTKDEREANRPRNVSICVECFSVDLADAAVLQRANMDDSKFYKELVDRVAKGKAMQEQFIMIRARSGEKAVIECISESIYPTEYEHGSGPKPAQPQKLGVGAPDTDAVPPAGAPNSPTVADLAGASDANPAATFAPPLGTSFETRNVGATLEVEPTISEKDDFVDLRFAPDIVTYAGRTKYSSGPSETEMPTFESQRTSTALTMRNGQPCLVGTPSRPPISAVDPNSAKRVWFSFVTATVIKP